MTPSPPATCGTGAWTPGTWTPGSLEIHHINVGQGDAALVVGPTGRTLLIDVGEPRWESSEGARRVGTSARRVLGCARIDTVLITHFHLDHVGMPDKGGLWHLVHEQGFTVGKTLHRDIETFTGKDSATLRNWRAHLRDAASAPLHAQVVRRGSGQIDLGPGVSVEVVAVDANRVLKAGDLSEDVSPPGENDYSVALRLRFGKLDYFAGGDLSGEYLETSFATTYHDIEMHVARRLPDMDVYRVSHHGSDHSSSETLLAQIDPEVSVISVGNTNPYGHPRQGVVDRLLTRGSVYLTERGDPRTKLGQAQVVGDVVLRTSDGARYTVAGTEFVATDPARVDSDGDGYFREADPDDAKPAAVPSSRGGCGPRHQICP
jgi:beta-lactamase superfamily II metal-dependent hydrolase